MQLDFLKYPVSAGFKDRETSFDAALKIESTGRADRLRARALDEWKKAGLKGLTPDECAENLQELPTSIRPRATELKKRGQLKKHPRGTRRRNETGGFAAVLVHIDFIKSEAHS